MQKLSSKQLVPVYMTTRLNEVRLAAEPPVLPADLKNSAMRQAVASTLNEAAKSWDMYRDVVQLSFLWEGCSYHFMLCDNDSDSDVSTEIENRPDRIIRTYTDESRLIADAIRLICEMYGVTVDGVVTYPRLMVGWRMSGMIWPILVNRAVKYRAGLPHDMLVAPDVKWTSGHYIGDIANIYLQGGSGHRPLPGFVDLLKFWGFWDDDNVMLPEDMTAAVCDAPVAVADSVDAYLKGMREMLNNYYGVTPQQSIPTIPNMGV